jgi:hypothetical protein
LWYSCSIYNIIILFNNNILFYVIAGAYITGDGVYRIVSHRMVHGYSTPLKKETGTDNNSNK